MLRFLHAADFHLDSPFRSLEVEQAVARRRESRELLERLARHAARVQADVVLLSGDLFDSDNAYRETAEALARALGSIPAPVFSGPGQPRLVRPGSPYAALDWPENVHIFAYAVESVELPELNTVVHGAAFTAPEQTDSLLEGFIAPADGKCHLMVLHGDVGASEARYDPLTEEEIARSGLTYLARAISTAVRDCAVLGLRSGPIPAALRDGALMSWGTRASWRAPWMTGALWR